MISELTFMQLASDQRKLQVHDHPLYPCSAYRTNWAQGLIEGVPWHWHRELEFMLVEHGSVYAEFSGKRILLEEGNGFFCNTKVLHRIRMTGCSTCHVHSFVVDGKMLAGGEGSFLYEKYLHPVLSAAGTFPGTALLQTDPGSKEILAHVCAAYAAAGSEPFGYEYDVRYHLSRALALVLASYRAAPADPGLRPDRDLKRVQAMLDFIHSNYAQKLELRDLAGHAGICEREAQRAFSRVLHQTPVQYLTEYRLQMAQKMLLQTDLSVLEIALACGMPNPSHFGRLFKENTGRTPARYRKEARLRL